MHILGHQRESHPQAGGMQYGEIRNRLDSALTSVFTEEGKKTVLFYMTEKYSLTLEQASANPSRLEDAMTSLLGEVGWVVVKRKILEQFNGHPVEKSFVDVRTASLGDAFGMLRSIAGSVAGKPGGL